MITDDPILSRLQAKEIELSKTEGWATNQSDHLGHQMGKKQASQLGQSSRV